MSGDSTGSDTEGRDLGSVYEIKTIKGRYFFVYFPLEVFRRPVTNYRPRDSPFFCLGLNIVNDYRYQIYEDGTD